MKDANWIDVLLFLSSTSFQGGERRRFSLNDKNNHLIMLVTSKEM